MQGSVWYILPYGQFFDIIVSDGHIWLFCGLDERIIKIKRPVLWKPRRLFLKNKHTEASGLPE